MSTEKKTPAPAPLPPEEVGYVSQDERWLQTWLGHRILPLVKGKTWRNPVGRGPGHKLTSYSGTKDGVLYAGKGSGPSMLLRMRPCKVRKSRAGR